MKKVNYEKTKDDILNEYMQKIQHLPQEYSVHLSPTKRAMLDYSLESQGFDSLQDLIDAFLPELFDNNVRSDIKCKELENQATKMFKQMDKIAPQIMEIIVRAQQEEQDEEN